jgi:hypothetical protein
VSENSSASREASSARAAALRQLALLFKKLDASVIEEEYARLKG